MDVAQKKITYRPEGAISPNAMGQNVVRTFDLAGDRLVITATPAEPDGLSGTRWTWDRVPLLENLTPANRKVLGFWRHVVEKRINLTTGATASEAERAPSVIVYTPSGYVGVHFPPLNRKPFAAALPTDDEARAAIAGVVSYYGAYTLSPRHRVPSSADHSRHGPRRYTQTFLRHHRRYAHAEISAGEESTGRGPSNRSHAQAHQRRKGHAAHEATRPSEDGGRRDGRLNAADRICVGGGRRTSREHQPADDNALDVHERKPAHVRCPRRSSRRRSR